MTSKKLRLGDVLTIESTQETIDIERPDGFSVTVPVFEGLAFHTLDIPGTYSYASHTVTVK